MKSLYKYILPLLVSGFTLSSCETEDAEPKAVRDYPTFSATIEGARTRAYDTSWESGDKIGIYYGDVVNLSHTHQGDGRFTVTDPDKQIIFTDDKEVEFTAYYPHSTLSTSSTYKGKVTFTGSDLDQSKQKEFDFLWAKAKGSKADPDVNFHFTHRMSKITIEFVAGEGIDLSTITKYSISGLYLKGTFDPVTGNCVKTASTRTSASVDLSKVNVSDNPISSVIVFPQTMSTTTLTITITATNANIGTITGKLAFEDKNLEAGKNYHFVVTVSKIGLAVGNVTIKEWTPIDQGDNWEAW